MGSEEQLFHRRRKPDWTTVGASYESARYVASNKGADMVFYLRERRLGDKRMASYHRGKFLIYRRAVLRDLKARGADK